MIHGVIYSEHFSEEPVKDLYRKQELPESDEVHAERYAAENSVPLDCLDYPA